MELKCLDNVDWKLLRKQKLALVEMVMDKHNHHLPSEKKVLEGIINMLDSIQDEAAEIIGERKVFGEKFGMR